MRLWLESYRLSQALADEQPGDSDVRMLALSRSNALVAQANTGMGRDEEVVRALREEKELAEKLVGDDPAGTVKRKRLALTCLIWGEVLRERHQLDACAPPLREACEHYKALTRRQPDDLLARVNLAVAGSRLMGEKDSDAHYAEAVAMFEEAADQLDTLRRQARTRDLAATVLLDCYCWLATCHWHAGRAELAEQTFQQRVRPLIARFPADSAENMQDMLYLRELLRAGALLRGVKPAALVVAQEAAARFERLAASPSRDISSSERLVAYCIGTSATLCRLGDATTALRLAQQARKVSSGLHQAAPGVPRYTHELSEAWERVAKARWELGSRDQALAALREAARLDRQVFEQVPSVQLYRNTLTRCYKRLAYYSESAGDRSGAAAALLERGKLWPGDANELQSVAQDFRGLAGAVGKGRERLSPDEQAECQRDIAESQRAEEEARKLKASRSPH